MRQWFFKSITTLLMMTVFLVYSSGLVITVHHCCHKHHHAANDHRHCHESTYFFKITDNYDISNTQHIESAVATYVSATSNVWVDICQTLHIINIIRCSDHFPPPLLLENQSILNYISIHRI